MSNCYNSTGNSSKVLCTKPCVNGMYGSIPCAASSEGTQTVKHTLNSNATATFGPFTIPILNTIRNFTFIGGSNTTPLSRDVTGSISESIKQTSCIFHYVNSAEEVCLYKKTVTKLSFSGSESGCVSSLHFNNSYAKVIVSNLSLTKDHTYILLRNGLEETLGSYSENSGGSGVWKMFLAPTPDLDALQFDLDIQKYGFYNDYDSCPNAAVDSLTALDGGPDMFYPEWARDWTPDMMWQQVAVNKFYGCKSGTPILKDNFGFGISTEPVPIGDFARHPKLGDCYSWLLSLGKDIKLVNFINGQKDDSLLSDALKPHHIDLKKLVAYYPISLI